MESVQKKAKLEHDINASYHRNLNVGARLARRVEHEAGPSRRTVDEHQQRHFEDVIDLTLSGSEDEAIEEIYDSDEDVLPTHPTYQELDVDQLSGAVNVVDNTGQPLGNGHIMQSQLAKPGAAMPCAMSDAEEYSKSAHPIKQEEEASQTALKMQVSTSSAAEAEADTSAAAAASAPGPDLDAVPYLIPPTAHSSKVIRYPCIPKNIHTAQAPTPSSFTQRAFPPPGAVYTISQRAHQVLQQTASKYRLLKPAKGQPPKPDGLYLLTPLRGNRGASFTPISKTSYGSAYQQHADYYHDIITANPAVEARVALRTISDPCHPVHLNPFCTLEHLPSDGFALGAFANQDIRKGDLLGTYFGYITSCWENHQEICEDVTSATAVRRSFTFDIKWSTDLSDEPDEQLVILGDRHSCKMACVNDPTWWVRHRDFPAPPCTQRSACNCLAYKNRKINAMSLSAVLKHRGLVLPMLLYIAEADIPKGREVLISYGGSAFFESVRLNLRAYNCWLGAQKRIRALEQREADRQQAAAAAAAAVPLVPAPSVLGSRLQGAAAQVAAAGSAQLAQLLQQVEQHMWVLEKQQQEQKQREDSRVAELEQQLQQAQQQVAGLQQEKALVVAQLAAAKEEAQQQVAGLQQENAQLLAQLASANEAAAKAAALQPELDKLQQQLQQQADKLAAQSTELAEQGSQLSSKASEAVQLQAQLEGVQQELQQAQQQAAALQATVLQLQGQVSSLQQELDEKERQLQAVRARRQQLGSQLSAARQEIEELRGVVVLY